MANGNTPSPPSGPIVEWVQFILRVVVIPWAIWVTWSLSQMNANRWSALDHAKYAANQAEQVSALWQAVQRNSLQRDVPPEWFSKAIDRLSGEIGELRQRISEVERAR